MYTERYKRYVLGTLTLVYTLNYLDRGLIVLLLQPIKEDLRLSDTQLGFVTGIAFALFYATLGLPIARWADRGNRVTITSLAIGLWGLTVMASVWVSNFYQLIVARVAAAVGEAGCMPPTYSLVGDYYSEPTSRVRAMAVYMLASPLSGLLSFVLGGWLNELVGWRHTFFVMGIPGLVLALVVKRTIAEPRMSARLTLDASADPPSVAKVIRILWHQTSSRHLAIAFILVCTMSLGMAPWYAAFMIRSHGMSTSELGFWLGLIFGLGGLVGTLLGGYISSRWAAEDERRQMRLCAVMMILLVPFFAIFLLVSDKHLALAVLIPLIVAFNFFMGPTFALMQRLVRSDMRATTLAVVMLLANLIGMGIGPQVVGIFSDALLPSFGQDSLRYAMLIISCLALWAAYHFWCVGGTVRNDLSRACPSQDDSNDQFQPVPTEHGALRDEKG